MLQFFEKKTPDSSAHLSRGDNFDVRFQSCIACCQDFRQELVYCNSGTIMIFPLVTFERNCFQNIICSVFKALKLLKIV